MARESEPKAEFLRHAVATVAYRGAKAMRGAQAEFAEFAARIRRGLRFRLWLIWAICLTGR